MSNATPKPPNNDESLVPAYTLPDVLGVGEKRVTDIAGWENKRRPEILESFYDHVYGRPPRGEWVREVVSKRVLTDTLFKHGVLEEWTVRLSNDLSEHEFHMLVAMPHGDGPFPAFCGLNFHGNQTTHSDPVIPISQRWVRNREDWGVFDNKCGESTRGVSESRWPYDEIMRRGYAVATVHAADFAPDGPEHFRDGIDRLFTKPGEERQANSWGAIGMWAWGLSRIGETLREDARIDARHVIVTGHSRMGKAALWCGAQDQRFSMVISNDSGCGGASLSRREFGETVALINYKFPHWFCPRFHSYAAREDALPVDQHMLLALSAPRPLHVCSASEDFNADPRGEFLSAKHAAPVYRLYAVNEVPEFGDYPEEEKYLPGRIAYHLRAGKHDITALDWRWHLDTADRYMLGRAPI